MRFPKNIWYYPPKRVYVRCNRFLVERAKDSVTFDWDDQGQVDRQEFILAAGAEIYLLAGLLGLGVGYLIASRSRCPCPGERTKVIPNSGKTYTGEFEGIGNDGRLYVGNRDFDPDSLRMAGPVKPLRGVGDFLDLNAGWVNPDELAKFKRANSKELAKFRRAHHREGYRKRRKGK